MAFRRLLFALVCLFGSFRAALVCVNPPSCECEVHGQYKILCDGSRLQTKPSSFEKFISGIPLGTKMLNVTGFNFPKLPPHGFSNVSSLRALRLRGNRISEIASSALHGLAELKRLDLSDNELKSIPKDAFRSLSRLERVDLAQNPLQCDCELSWLWDWDQKARAVDRSAISTATVCKDGRPWQQLKKGDFGVCATKVEIAEVVTYPVREQLTFLGDSLRLTCSATPSKSDADLTLLWVKDGLRVSDATFEGVKIKHIRAGSKLRVDLEIPRLESVHDGDWICLANSTIGNETRVVTLRVIAEKSLYCPDAMTEGNKGRFAWPRSLSGTKISLPCSFSGGFPPDKLIGSSLDPIGTRGAVAWHECNLRGAWDDLDDSACPFVSVTTKILEQFAEAEIKLPNEDSALKSAKHLKNYTMNATVIKDPIDIVFIGRTIEKYLSYVSSVPKNNRELAGVLIEIAAVIQGMEDEELLREAQFAVDQGRPLSRIVYSLEQIPRLIPDFYHDGPRISISSQPVDIANFPGMYCQWVDGVDRAHREIKCSLHRNYEEDPAGTGVWSPSEVEADNVIAAVSIPSEVLSPDALGRQLVRLTHTQWPTPSEYGGLSSSVYAWGGRTDYKRQQWFDFLAFDSAALFLDSDVSIGDIFSPVSNSERPPSRIIVGPVIGCKMSPFPPSVTDPKTAIEVSLKLPFVIPTAVARDIVQQSHRDPDSVLLPPPLAGAIWNESEARWDVGGNHCAVTGIRGAVVQLSCRRCGYFGVSVDRKHFPRIRPGAGSYQRLPHSMVFVGSGLCAGCLFMAVVVYIAANNRVTLAVPLRHSLANTWISMGTLVTLYCCGIYQTDDPSICQGIGLLLHYFLQASVMWMINSLSYLKSCVQLPHEPVGTSEDEGPDAQQGADPRNPGEAEGKLLSQMYLLGYGVPGLICSVSAAVHMKEYGGPYLCTLSWRPMVWAILIPLCVAVVVLWVFYLSIQCTLKCGVASLGSPLAEGQQVVDQEQLEAEHQSQLNSHTVVFLLFAATVTFAAKAAAHDITKDEEDEGLDPYRIAWASLYGIWCSVLGVFVLVRFSFQKVDFNADRNEKAKTPVLLPTPPPVIPPMSVSAVPPASSVTAAEDPIALNGSLSSARTGVDPRVASVPMTRSLVSGESFAPPPPLSVSQQPQQPPSTVPPSIVASNPIFYDPQQMSVAKRFFEKQRRKQNKHFAVATPDSWVDTRQHPGSRMASGSELYLGSGFGGGDADETSSHFTSVSNQRPNSGGHQRMCKWSDSEVSVPCRRTRWGSGGGGPSGDGRAGGPSGARWPRRQKRADSCSSRGGMEMEPLVPNPRSTVLSVGMYQQERVVIGQESVHGHGGLSVAVATTSTTSDVLLQDVDSEDGLSLMRPMQPTSPSRSVISDGTCATYNSSNVAAMRIRGLDNGGASQGLAGAVGGRVKMEVDRGMENRGDTTSSLSSCSASSCQNKRETCI